jgi:hypothetical protein
MKERFQGNVVAFREEKEEKEKLTAGFLRGAGGWTRERKQEISNSEFRKVSMLALLWV